MKASRIRFAGVALLAACLLATACGGGGDDDKKDDIRALLQSMALAPAVLPEGLQQASVSVSTNQDVADASLDPEATLAKLEGYGRRLGYDVQFEPGQDAPSTLAVQGMQNTVSLYKTAAGAGEALAEGLSGARATDWPAVNPDQTGVEMEELPLPSEVDEGGWFRISGTDDSGNLIIDDQIAFRVDTVRGFVRAVTVFPGSEDRDSYRDEVEGWVTTAANRIRDALEG